MENNLENLTIGVFAKAAGVNVETIRFYQRKGLLREPDKPYGSIRRYGEACHARKGNVSCPLIASLQGEAGLARSAMP
ncbi:MerR family DNA-binding transcriptional regulator [Escherichia coli]|uniref:MerR family DNA-binding transcriptional regulator n=1 Tax=Escherichia coli TaxID=562 RepID=UPI000DF44548|nr:MerR family DNA-binding transcriptional regulator [Escherichia coli]RCZ59534.1 MerR family DNA-binding transcriptional regulator [Escherichia coli]